MIETLKLIKEYIPELYTIKLNKNKKDKNMNLISYNIFDKIKANIGYINLTDSGKLKSYAYSGKTLKYIEYPLTEVNIVEEANLFLKIFVKDSNLTLSSITTYSNKYQVIYEERDTEYNLYLPGTGAEIILNLAGNILKFDKKEDEYEVIYPDKTITSKEAKSYYLNRLNLDLKVSKPTNHTHYKLVYRINEEIDYVSASGKEHDSKLIKQELISMEPFATSSKNLLRVLGLDGTYTKIGKKNIKKFRIELWSKHLKKSLTQLNFDINESQLDVIKYKINKHTNEIVQICDGEVLPEEMKEVITNKKAFEHALDFLFTVYPKANELFDILELVTDSEDKNNQNSEPNYMYYFNRVHDSIEIENQIAYIGVGKYTGKINNYCAQMVTEKELAHINVFAKVSEADARALYGSKLEMDLGFVKKENELRKPIYELVYLPTYVEEKTKITLIDAHEGILYES